MLDGEDEKSQRFMRSFLTREREYLAREEQAPSAGEDQDQRLAAAGEALTASLRRSKTLSLSTGGESGARSRRRRAEAPVFEAPVHRLAGRADRWSF